MMKLKFLYRQAYIHACRQLQRMRNILAILALFACTSICLGQNVVNVNTNDGTGNYYTYAANSANANGREPWTLPPINCTLNISGTARVLNAFGAHMCYGSMTGNKVNVNGGWFNGSIIAGAYSDNISATVGNAVDNNEVTITNKQDGNIRWVYGGRAFNTSASNNTVTISGVDIGNDANTEYVCGGYVHTYGLARDNKVRITDGNIKGNVYGGYLERNGIAIENRVNLTNVTVNDVYGAKIETGSAINNIVTINDRCCVKGNVYGAKIETGSAINNIVTINDGCCVKGNVYGAKIETGSAINNIVTINDGCCVKGNVYGARINEGVDLGASKNKIILKGSVDGNVCGAYIERGEEGEEEEVSNDAKIVFVNTTVDITESTKFSTTTILCGGGCADPTVVFKGITLNIEAKGVAVKGISNFENYNFHLKDIKPGEVILTATNGGCDGGNNPLSCAVDVSRSNITLRTQGVLNKGAYTLIKSPRGFKNNIACKKFDFDNRGLVKYYWKTEVADNRQDLIAILTDKKIRDEGVTKSLSEGYRAGIVCTNNGMDCVLSKMEETESVLGEGAKLQRKGEIGVFCGLAANKSSYNEGSHIDMIGMSMMGGVGIRVEVGSKKLSFKGQSPKELSSKKLSFKEQSSPELGSELGSKELSSELTAGVFAECGTGNSDIDSGLCPCEKKSEAKSNYVGGGLLGRYNVYGDEFRGTKLYGEAILRAGQVNNSFESKEAKGKEYKYDYEPAMYGGCALGGGYKHKVGEKMDVDWSLRYIFGYQSRKDVERVDADGNEMKFESVKSNRIRVGVRGKYVELEKVKPYLVIGYEHELNGEVKGAIQNGVDRVGDIPATSFGGGTGIMEVGASWKIWKLDVDISGQGYVGVRKGFGGMLKLKYAFGKDAHAKPQPKDK